MSCQPIGFWQPASLQGWLAPKTWPAAMPPISLVALVAALVPLVVKRRLVAKKNARQQRSS